MRKKILLLLLLLLLHTAQMVRHWATLRCTSAIREQIGEAHSLDLSELMDSFLKTCVLIFAFVASSSIPKSIYRKFSLWKQCFFAFFAFFASVAGPILTAPERIRSRGNLKTCEECEKCETSLYFTSGNCERMVLWKEADAKNAKKRCNSPKALDISKLSAGLETRWQQVLATESQSGQVEHFSVAQQCMWCRSHCYDAAEFFFSHLLHRPLFLKQFFAK